jgi:type IV pilus assembly protein PilE
MKMLKKTRGFNLVELLVTLSVIGILAGVAYPSYQKQMQKTRRADATGALLGLANAMERYYTENNSYLGAAGTSGTPADTGAPRIYATQSPVDGGTKYYDLTINAATATTYTLRATPVSTGPQGSDKCQILTLTNAGVKGTTASGMTAADCW